MNLLSNSNNERRRKTMKVSVLERAESIKTKKNKNFNPAKIEWCDIALFDPSELYIDTDYQRILQSSLVQKIINDFNPDQFGTVKIAERIEQETRHYYVVDGQHRVIAAFLLDIKEIPCLFIEGDGKEKEARLFNKQKVRKNLTPYNLFVSAVAAGNQIETEINDFLKEIEVQPSNSIGPRKVSFISGIISRWKRNKQACKQAMKSILTLEENMISGQLYGGFFHLEECGIRTIDKIGRIYKAGGYNAVLANYNSIRANLGPNTKGQDRFWAQAIVNVYNKNLRKCKIYL
jgi:hypothetical protein